MIDLVTQGRPGRVLIFGAHPDDAEIGAVATLARMARLGTEVTIAVASVPHDYETRVREAQRGAAALGARCVILPQQASRVEDIPMHEQVRRMDALVRDVRPDLVFVHSQSDLHWDHSLTTRAALSALRRTPCHLFAFASSYELNAQARFIGQCFVDVSETLDAKIEAIKAHVSQQQGLDIEGLRNSAKAMGRKCGAAAAEVFEVLRLTL